MQKDDEWLVLASDGIWEVLSLEQVSGSDWENPWVLSLCLNQVGEIIAGGCDATAVCRELISKAKQIWRDEEGCDPLCVLSAHDLNSVAEKHSVPPVLCFISDSYDSHLISLQSQTS